MCCVSAMAYQEEQIPLQIIICTFPAEHYRHRLNWYTKTLMSFCSGSTIVGIGSPDPPSFVYDDGDYKDVFMSGMLILHIIFHFRAAKKDSVTSELSN